MKYLNGSVLVLCVVTLCLTIPTRAMALSAVTQNQYVYANAYNPWFSDLNHSASGSGNAEVQVSASVPPFEEVPGVYAFSTQKSNLSQGATSFSIATDSRIYAAGYGSPYPYAAADMISIYGATITTTRALNYEWLFSWPDVFTVNSPAPLVSITGAGFEHIVSPSYDSGLLAPGQYTLLVDLRGSHFEVDSSPLLDTHLESWFTASEVPIATPEPASCLLVGMGLAGLIASRRRKER